MNFDYVGYKPDGSKTEGRLVAETYDLAVMELEKKSIIIVTLAENSDVEFDLKATLEKLFPQQVKVEDLIIFCRQMNALTRAGVPLLKALKGLTESMTNKTLSHTCNAVRLQVDTGIPVATALAAYPKIFGPIFVSMINVGENTGNLDAAFEQVAFYLDMERETKKRIKQATRYPTIVIGAVSVAVGVINVFVIPAFAGVFEKFGTDLPLMTKILIGSSNFTVNYGWLMGILSVAGVIAFKRYTKTKEGILKYDHFKLKMPLLGTIFERIVLARFARVFSMLSSAGVPILSAITHVASAVGNAHVEDKVMKMHDGIERGDSFYRTAQASKLFTPLVLQMISVGEETGQIDEMLQEVAVFYEQEVDYDLKKLGDAIEPILLVFMGGLVLVLALGVFLPMWNLSSAV